MANTPWTDAELRASVACYAEIFEAQRKGQRVVKTDLYRRYAEGEISGRSPKSIELRMTNISAILHSEGLEFAQGLLPRDHVGANVVRRLRPHMVDSGLLPDPDPDPTADPAELEAKALQLRRGGRAQAPRGQAKPSTTTATATVYLRSPGIVAHALDLANGVCDLCSEPAPFLRANGEPFLEVHHVRPLADGGSDTPSNTVALCPNCHRRLHHSADAEEARRALYRKHPHLRPE